ncbi:hypothetical protein CC53_gp075 [Rhizobium phage vB_RleS_L338C]|uniref:hypothetical protein n=1 Tax=Rhizobium phage vB_RleS_L338C TaxID=1414737 RepID=UPI0003D8DA12|nr:hypothetical protein CC53_gp075 [Rhizobium phage vB_RleS_L338C]AHC30492.1 hypothetical protein L338C_075 [Rhizobium phage vB_RleS_L338C]QNH72081.1 hypothetical protein P11VFA_071 [Rhizobium phage P11VFA]
MNTPTTAKHLQGVMHLLPAKDQSFAKSLISARNPTEKQLFWIGKLFDRAVGAECKPERETATVGDMAGINAMFDRIGKTKLRRPAIVLHTDYCGDVRLNVAGPGAQVPGSINVVAVDGGQWFGRVTKSGVFEKSFKHETPDSVVDILREFAAEPLEVAARHGKLTGRCCFCNHGLKDPKSTARGYGPICARAWVGA